MILSLSQLDERILCLLLLMVLVPYLYQTFLMLRTCAYGLAPAIQIFEIPDTKYAVQMSMFALHLFQPRLEALRAKCFSTGGFNH